MTQEEFYEDLLGFSDLKINSIEKTSQKIIFHCEVKTKVSTCPNCLEPTGIINQYETRKVQDLKISEHEVWLHIRVSQFICPTCNRYFFDTPDWVMPGKSYTRRQSKWVFELCRQQSFTRVGALVNLSHKTVERLFYEEAEKQINLPERYARVRKLGIDEISHRKGKKDYACVLTDLERGTQLDVLPDRKKETLIAHFQSLGTCFCNQVEVVCCDIWKTYINVAKECFPNAEIVIDRFHIVKALNEVLDTLRKSLRREFKEEDCFKSIKWKLFKRPEKCTETDFALLQNAFGKSWLLEEIYQLRNTFNSMFDISKSKQQLERNLDWWIGFAEKLEYRPLNSFIKTLKNWKSQVTAFASQRVTNAITEGLNNYLRYFKRISFGLPNFEHMRLRILLAAS
ncbi:MAG: ISL3 family transposase [Saprospiraceae bacterium]